MLKRVQTLKRKDAGRSGAFAIVASRYNRRYVDSMLNAARRCLEGAGAIDVRVVRVPGAYEIPVVAARLAKRDGEPLSAIICLGVILRGQTTHAQHIGEAVTFALTELQIRHGIPIIHEVLLLENEEQAKVRCLSRDHNRGTEAAQTALEMAWVIRNLNDSQAR
jgi:6,7-dimethyl-8-ribityllumazine synthase